MNEQLQQALAEILNKTMVGVEAGTAFLQAELPDVIQQLLMWKLAQASVMLAFSILGSLQFITVTWISAKHSRNGGFFDLDCAGIPCLMISACIAAVSVCGVFTWGADALQIWLAPKIYLIEYAASLAK